MRATPGFRTMTWRTDGTTQTAHDVAYARPDAGPPVRDADVRVIAFRLGRPWTPDERFDRGPFPRDAAILVLPFAQPRPEGARSAAQLQAALLTPLTLLGDLVAVPVVAVGCAVFGRCP